MKKILMTGSTGFIGSNILPILRKNADLELYTPKRAELDLKNEENVVKYLTANRFDVVLHFANPTPGKNPLDSDETMAEDSLRIFLNFYNHRDLFGRMIYTGSGAEYDKTMDIELIEEDRCFRSVPKDPYGLAKMVMNHLAQSSDNVYNFRIFGCFGPGDHESKFITHCIRSILLDKDITIRKDCEFDYLHVYDLARYVEWGIETDLEYHDFNVTTGRPVLLSEIAAIVLDKMGSDRKVKILSDERNRNYTASNKRIVEQSGLTPKYSLEDGIDIQIGWEKENWSENTKFDGE